jgi:hypothetical protein
MLAEIVSFQLLRDEFRGGSCISYLGVIHCEVCCPPGMMSIEVTHEVAEGGWGESMEKGGQAVWPARGVEVEDIKMWEGEKFEGGTKVSRDCIGHRLWLAIVGKWE